MPRPGPRPYECVKRAWHSDRHKPIRGSLIQEIFRVVNEIHSLATRKNKEWQEKLPIVVLKAEEIMYSKANSEAEYVDLKTLWNRVNDAINTIIRRDESSENGELLQPCIEAALNLGCTARRESRSQRNCNPRCYLTAANSPKANFETMTQVKDTASAKMSPHDSKFMNSNTINESRFPFDKFPPTGSTSCSVYPLYYGGNPIQSQDSKTKNSQATEPMEKYTMQNPEKSPDSECDLSLRLGRRPISVPCASVEEDVGSSTCQVLINSLAPQMDKGLVFFFNAEDKSGGSYSSENTSSEAAMRKRKAGLAMQSYGGQPKVPCNRRFT